MLNKNIPIKRPYSKEYIKKYALNYLNKFNANTEYLKMFIINKIKRNFLVNDMESLRQEIHDIISELSSKGFLNDISYCEFKIKYFLKTGNSIFDINNKLKQKNLSQYIISTAWNNILDSNSINELESYSLLKYAKKKNILLWQHNSNLPAGQFKKSINTLLRRGFHYDLINELLSTDNSINNSQENYENFITDIEIKYSL